MKTLALPNFHLKKRFLLILNNIYCFLKDDCDHMQTKFVCNICGHTNYSHREDLSRESISCFYCLSTVRTRSIVNQISIIVNGKSTILDKAPIRKDIIALGLSDLNHYAGRLANKYSYTNTFLHKSPTLDITCTPNSLEDQYHFIVATEVFEHVVAPVSRSFSNAFKLLKDGGSLVLSVPYSLENRDTTEHFPELNEWRIRKLDNKSVLVNKTIDGQENYFYDLVFHGGKGNTLEMRLFSLEQLLQDLQLAGFADVRIAEDEISDYGIVWNNKWSLPIVATKRKA